MRVARQYTGSAAKLPTVRSVFLLPTCRVTAMPSSIGALFAEELDRRSGSPEGHIRAGHIAFRPSLSLRRDDRARSCAGVPFRWLRPIASMGRRYRADLRQAGKGYVLGVNSNHWFASWGKPLWVVGTAEEIAKTQRRSDWRRLSAGAGTKGPDCTTGATSNWPISKAKIQPSQPSPLDTRPADPT